MSTTNNWPRYLLIAGYLAMLIGALDPMEGSLLILPGSGLVVLGSCYSGQPRRFVIYRMWLFLMILIGVTALWVISAHGGFGGDTGRSMWWTLIFVPYLAGWSLSIWGPGSPRWVVWSGIVVGIWYVMMMFLIIKMSYRGAGTAEEAMIFAGFIAAIGVITIVGCIYRLNVISKHQSTETE